MGRCDLWLTSDRYLPLGCGRTGFSFPPDVHNYDGRVSWAARGLCHHLDGILRDVGDWGWGGPVGQAYCDLPQPGVRFHHCDAHTTVIPAQAAMTVNMTVEPASMDSGLRRNDGWGSR